MAADVVERSSRIVRRISAQHEGRPGEVVGDGVMFYFPDPASGVAAAVEMVDALRDAELPPAHVGLHAGAVVFQQGDYDGQTVNLAARIGEFARLGEVLVSRAVLEATEATLVRFEAVGPVEFKGVSEPVELYAATSAPAGS